MKHAKTLLALLLALATAAALALPALAEETAAEIAEKTPVLTLQPQDTSVKAGEPFEMYALAGIPNKDPVAYLWYSNLRGWLWDQTGVTLRGSSADCTDGEKFICYVYNSEYDPWDGYYTRSGTATLRIRSNIFADIWYFIDFEILQPILAIIRSIFPFIP